MCFTVALECLMHTSDTSGGVNVLGVSLSRLEYADDAAVIDESIDKASTRISKLAEGSRIHADMEIRIDKAESMFLRDDECAWEVTFAEYEDVEWNHVCEYCGRGFDTKGGLNIHKGAHCKVARGLYHCNWVVDRLVDVRGEPHQRFYRVRWEGWEEKDDTWQNWRDFEEGGRQAIDDFWETQTSFERDKPAWVVGEIRCRNSSSWEKKVKI